MFCKKCHKIIIKDARTLESLKNRCRCEGDTIHLFDRSEMSGFLDAIMSTKKRSGTKRKLAKEVNSARI